MNRPTRGYDHRYQTLGRQVYVLDTISRLSCAGMVTKGSPVPRVPTRCRHGDERDEGNEGVKGAKGADTVSTRCRHGDEHDECVEGVKGVKGAEGVKVAKDGDTVSTR